MGKVELKGDRETITHMEEEPQPVPREARGARANSIFW